MNTKSVHSDIKLLDESGAVLFQTQKVDTVDVSADNFTSDQYVETLKGDIPQLLQEVVMQELFNDQKAVSDKIARVSQLQLRFEINGELIEKTVPLSLGAKTM